MKSKNLNTEAAEMLSRNNAPEADGTAPVYYTGIDWVPAAGKDPLDCAGSPAGRPAGMALGNAVCDACLSGDFQDLYSRI